MYTCETCTAANVAAADAAAEEAERAALWQQVRTWVALRGPLPVDCTAYGVKCWMQYGR